MAVYVPPIYWPLIDDRQLYDLQLSLALACGRSHSTLRKRHRQNYCLAFEALKFESERRGRPVPEPPFHSDSHVAA